MLQSQSISLNPTLRNAISSDPIRTIQTWEAEEEEERANAVNSEDVDTEEDGVHNEYSMQRNPYSKLFSSFGKNNKKNQNNQKNQNNKNNQNGKKYNKKHRRRRRLLHNEEEELVESDEKYLIRDDYEVKDNQRSMSGGSYFPRSITAPTEADISTYWDTVPDQPGFLSVEVRPLLDVVTHTDVIQRCFGKLFPKK